MIFVVISIIRYLIRILYNWNVRKFIFVLSSKSAQSSFVLDSVCATCAGSISSRPYFSFPRPFHYVAFVLCTYFIRQGRSTLSSIRADEQPLELLSFRPWFPEFFPPLCCSCFVQRYRLADCSFFEFLPWPKIQDQLSCNLLYACFWHENSTENSLLSILNRRIFFKYVTTFAWNILKFDGWIV